MATIFGTVSQPATEARQSWVPMIAIALGQVVMSFNVASLVVAMGGMVKRFNVSPMTVATAAGARSSPKITGGPGNPPQRLPNFISGEVPDSSPTTAWSKGR
jgi:hypothetical protein